MGDVIQYDFDAMNATATMIDNAATILRSSDVVMINLAVYLKTTGFALPIGAKYLEEYHDVVKSLYETCEALNGDLKQSISAIQNGDQQGTTKFH